MTLDVEVLLHGRAVGSLVEDDRGQWVFRFAESYLRLPERAVLGQKFEDDLTRAYRGKKASLPPFFANLVPEQGGELRPILETHLGIAEGDDISFLERLGRDLPGAVEVRRIAEIPDAREPALDDVIDPTPPADEDTEWMRFSLAGVQLKFSVIIAHNRITLPAHGCLGDWLVKLDSHRFPGLCENEHAIMLWARAAGFDVPQLILQESTSLVGKLGDYAEPGTHVLAVRRFDRDGKGGKIHQEDFAQVVNLLPQHKYDHVSYEDLARLIDAICGREAGDEFVRRLALMIASGNGDAHLKNWSLIYPDRVRARLAPLYDQVATVAWPKELARSLALKLGGTKRMSEIGRETLASFATRSGFASERVFALVDDALARLAAAWPDCSRQSGWSLGEAHAQALRDHWSATPLLRESPLSRL
jgi:serine/threonine-protein kinase HipA